MNIQLWPFITPKRNYKKSCRVKKSKKSKSQCFDINYHIIQFQKNIIYFARVANVNELMNTFENAVSLIIPMSHAKCKTWHYKNEKKIFVKRKRLVRLFWNFWLLRPKTIEKFRKPESEKIFSRTWSEPLTAFGQDTKRYNGILIDNTISDWAKPWIVKRGD